MDIPVLTRYPEPKMKRKFLIGCGVILLIIALIVGGLILASPMLFRMGKEWVTAKVEESNRLSELGKNWQPPSAKLAPDWFPLKIGEWSRGKTSVLTSVPALDLTRNALSATYENGRDRSVTMTIVAVDQSEKEAVIDHAKETLPKGRPKTKKHLNDKVTFTSTTGSSHWITQVDNRTHVIVDKNQHTRFWWVNGWLLIFQSTGSEDPHDFAEAFLTATDASAAGANLHR